MAAPATTAITWPWPADVLAFAAKHQVQPYLDPLLEVLRRLFPAAIRLQVYLEDDPEIRDDWHIIFDVQVRGWNVPQVREAQAEWHGELLHRCPGPLVCIFRLCLDVVPG
jgi:hypothetical protein